MAQQMLAESVSLIVVAFGVIGGLLILSRRPASPVQVPLASRLRTGPALALRKHRPERWR
jgi:hypothetical protein